MHFERIRYNTTTGEEEEREVFQIQAARFNQPFEPNAFTIELKPSTSITVDLPPDISFKVFRLPHEKSLRLGLDEIVEEARRAPELFTGIRQKEEQQLRTHNIFRTLLSGPKKALAWVDG
jgi:hypothetical protein